MSIVKQEPQRVFDYFEELCAIPHGSGNTDGIAIYLENFAKAHQFRYVRDKMNNIIVYKDAAKGYENAPPVILQGHTDMVCAKDADCTKDMSREGLDLRADGDFLFAEGTTLGGDDGIAVAMILAILESDLPMPAIEAVFTVDEEIGMFGAAALDLSLLHGRTMINVDSESEGVVTVGCAGGVMAKCTLPMQRISASEEALKISVSGISGGHSGEAIGDGRANAVTLLARLLLTISKETKISLADISGGVKENVIPSSAEAVITAQDADAVKKTVAAWEKIYRSEYAETDPELTLAAERTTAQSVCDAESTARAICFLTNLPNGVYAMSRALPGLVQTSLSLGVVRMDQKALYTEQCVRSNVGTQKKMLTDRIASLAQTLGGTVMLEGDYPAWEYRKESPLRNLMCAVYREQNGKDLRLAAIHGGLECGIFAGKIEDFDCVSVGPDILDIHSPRERLSIASTARVYAWITETLKRMQ